MRHAPSMTGLRVLEAVVRTGSLSAAARELCVTPAAVSHRLRALERDSGTALVLRSDNRFQPTEAGREVIAALGDAFERIRRADAMIRTDRPETLRIAASYSFAVLWLIPRIGAFQARHPEAELFIHPTHRPLAAGPADVRILHSARPPDEGDWTCLFQDRCAAMARPDHPLLSGGPVDLGSLMQQRLVHISHDNGPDWGEFSWDKWALAKGLAPQRPRGAGRKGSSVSAEHLAVDLLLSGDSLALISVVNASLMTADGRLASVPGSECATGCGYWITTTGKNGPGRRLAHAFGRWITEDLGPA
ncbi:MAG: LysR family transcriptional regulator [Rubellimicrobium sp.]|nr:LysR family transcriptional regulator [Rubellimicrobium sp.]